LFKYRDQKRIESVRFYLPNVNEIGPVRIEFDAVEEDGILRKGKGRGCVMFFLQQSFPIVRCQVSYLRSVELRRGKQVLEKRNMEAET
jgi:hypothetical protein